MKKKDNLLMVQIKKERLDQHLSEVENLIRGWIPQLSATDPFASYTRGDSWGWQSPYLPDSERDADSNHMLRKHLKGRALWKHHFDWQWRLDRVFKMLAGVREKASKPDRERQPGDESLSKKMAYTEGYLGTALWLAFGISRNRAPNLDYMRGDGGKGVRFGGYVIETSSASETDFKAVREDHRNLGLRLSKLGEMKEMAEEWAVIEELQGKMQRLADKSLKSSDYLYPCTFCKRLWRA
jgi:hypothetical protein